MKINAQTKIADLLKEDGRMTEVLMEISPKFKKLLNPVLCKAVAPRVRVADAAKIGGVSVEEFLRKLEEHGFEVDYADAKAAEEQTDEKCRSLKNYRAIPFDARAILDRGEDPLNDILRALGGLKDGETLEIYLDFVPYPLLDLLKKKAWDYCVKRENGIYRTYIFRPAERPGLWKRLKSLLGFSGAKEEMDTGVKSSILREMTVEELTKQTAGKEGRIIRMDVRELEMPQPMMQILQKLESMKPDEILLVEHKRIPQYLLPELEKKGYRMDYAQINDDHFRLLIYKDL